MKAWSAGYSPAYNFPGLPSWNGEPPPKTMRYIPEGEYKLRDVPNPEYEEWQRVAEQYRQAAESPLAGLISTSPGNTPFEKMRTQ